jgi:hypothetical protein
LGALSPQAQKILDPAAPQALKGMAAKGLAPGMKPGDILAIVCALALGGDAHAETAQKTLGSLPAPLLNGALAGDVQAGVLDTIGPLYVNDAALAEKILHHRSVHPATVAKMAALCNESVAELIATNEVLLLDYPPILENLYLNPHTRMSTADRILELAARNDVDCPGIPAFEQAKKAIVGELIVEAGEAPNFDDEQFALAEKVAKATVLTEDEDTHRLDEESGEEVVVEKARPLHAVWADLRPPAKIRLLTLGKVKTVNEKRQITEHSFDLKAVRMLGIRDPNPLVALAALDAPGMGESEIVRVASMRNVSEDVLRAIANAKEWTRTYQVKFNLVANPRTPFTHSAKFVIHLRDNDLKTVSRSKDVPGAIQRIARQQLTKKGK